MDKYHLQYINYLFLMSNLANIVQSIMNEQENTKKMAHWHVSEMNGDVEVVCNQKDHILNTHFLGS